jgi:hypothetical protein
MASSAVEAQGRDRAGELGAVRLDGHLPAARQA